MYLVSRLAGKNCNERGITQFPLKDSSAIAANALTINSAVFRGLICSLQFEICALEKGEVEETSGSFLN